MTDSLRAKLTYVCATAGVNLHLSEAETDNYPYAVYDMTTNPLLDKDGVYGYMGDCKIRLVSDNVGDIDTLCATVQSAILTGMRDSDFFSKLVDVTKECVDDIWTIELNYTLKQYADWAVPVEPVEQTNSDTD